MLKYSLVFAGGMVTTAAIAYKGQASAGAWFLIGILVTLTVQAGLLAKTTRIRGFARFLSAFAAAWSDKTTQAADSPSAAQIVPETPALDLELVSSLVNMGATKKQARAAAAQVTGETFDDRLRQAVRMVRS